MTSPLSDRQDAPTASSVVVQPEGGAFLAVDIGRLLAWLRAGMAIIALATVVGAALGVGYAMLTKPRFTATADVIVHPSDLQILQDDLFASNQQSTVPLLLVDSKVRVLTSRNVLQRVVEKLDLQNDPEFNKPPSLISSLIFGAPEDKDPAQKARATLADRIRANREERSFVVTVSTWSYQREKAVALSDAVIEAFREELTTGDAARAASAADTLMVRLEELRRDVTDAEQRVEAFRAQNKLQTTDGELASTRSMAEFNALLVDAQARLVRAETRYNSLASAANDPQNNTSVLQSDTISNLKQQYSALYIDAARESRIYGPRHPSHVAMQRQLAEIEQMIRRETDRIVSAARSEMEQARVNLSSLRAGAASVRDQVDSASEAEVQLRELQREAISKASVYEAFLGRATQASERQQIDSTNIRVISPAIVPINRSWPPRTSAMGIVGLLAGFAIGALIAIGRGLAGELRSQAIAAPALPRSRDDVTTGEPAVASHAVATPGRPPAGAVASPAGDAGPPTSRPANSSARRRRGGSLLGQRGGSLLDYA